jgi:hypothetical protein
MVTRPRPANVKGIHSRVWISGRVPGAVKVPSAASTGAEDAADSAKTARSMTKHCTPNKHSQMPQAKKKARHISPTSFVNDAESPSYILSTVAGNGWNAGGCRFELSANGEVEDVACNSRTSPGVPCP